MLVTDWLRVGSSCRFATRARDGLLLYNGRYNERHDFIALEVAASQLRFSFSVGSGAHHVTGRVPGGVSDGAWHQVEVDYHNRVSAAAAATVHTHCTCTQHTSTDEPDRVPWLFPVYILDCILCICSPD